MLVSTASSWCCAQLQLLPSVGSDAVLCSAASATADCPAIAFGGEKYPREKDLEQTLQEDLKCSKELLKALRDGLFYSKHRLKTDKYLTRTAPQTT